VSAAPFLDKTMAKHGRKRQKTSDSHEPAPSKAARLAMLLDDENKDDEERKLESLLFGVKYEPRNKGIGVGAGDESERDEVEEGGRGMQHLLDQDASTLRPWFLKSMTALFSTDKRHGMTLFFSCFLLIILLETELPTMHSCPMMKSCHQNKTKVQNLAKRVLCQNHLKTLRLL